MQLLYSPLISWTDPCASMQEWTEAATELSSITIYKNFLAVCGLSHAYTKDIIHLVFSPAEETEPFSEIRRNCASVTCTVTSWSSYPFTVTIEHSLISQGKCKQFFLTVKAYVSETFLNQIGQNRKDTIIVSAFPLWQLWKHSYVSEVLCHLPCK